MSNCVKCGKESDWLSKSGYCEECAEAILSAHKNTSEPKEKLPPLTIFGVRFRWWFIPIGFLILVIISSAINGLTGRSDNSTAVFVDLGTIAEIAVKDSLKAPTTAEFPDISEYEYRQSKDDPSIYFILGYVDAENSFGAKLRNDFIVKCRYTSFNDYEILGVELD